MRANRRAHAETRVLTAIELVARGGLKKPPTLGYEPDQLPGCSISRRLPMICYYFRRRSSQMLVGITGVARCGLAARFLPVFGETLATRRLGRNASIALLRLTC